MLPTAVSNHLHDPKSQNEHQQLPQLRLDFQAQRLRISPVLAINPAVLERNSIEANLKLVARVAATKKGHRKALARNNEDNRKVKEATIAKAVQAAGGKVTKAVGGPTSLNSLRCASERTTRGLGTRNIGGWELAGPKNRKPQLASGSVELRRRRLRRRRRRPDSSLREGVT